MSKDNGQEDSLDIDLVRQLADLLTDTGLTEIEIERGGMRIKVARSLGGGYVESIPTLQAQPAPALIAAPSAPAPPSGPAPTAGETVKSPMVGTVYLQTNPGAPRLVKPGDRVAAGQTLLIIEAMKTMNPVPAPRAGVVLEILVDDEQPVEFGEPLLVLE
jgi:acetyl-CoA carboxylase biotin carboxyl carrier protein